jgi:hypothetical protein
VSCNHNTTIYNITNLSSMLLLFLPNDGIILYILCHRVYDNWPLNDVLNLFEKGHCQMAVVIQSKEDANNIANNAIGNTNMFTINTTSSACRAQR